LKGALKGELKKKPGEAAVFEKGMTVVM